MMSNFPPPQGLSGATGNATPADVLNGATFSTSKGEGQTGTMPNNGAVTLTPSGTGTVPIPAGYHDGSGEVAQVNVPAADVLSGTGIAGVTGTMPNNGAVTLTPSGTGPVSIPAGYHNGSGEVAQVSVPASDVLSGATIADVAGTMPNRGAPTWTPGTSNQGLSAGYYSGGVVEGDGNLQSGNIKNGVSIFNITGNLQPKLYASGSGTSSGSGQTLPFTTLHGSTSNYYYAQVSGLSFTPKTININFYAYENTVYSAAISNSDNAKIYGTMAESSVSEAFQLDGTNAYVNSSGFRLPHVNNTLSETFTWEAWG